MAVLTAQSIAAAGTTPSYAAAAGGGDTCVAPAGKSFVHVKNGSGGSITVTVASNATAGVGLAASNRAIAIPAGQERMIPIEDAAWINSSTGAVSLTYSGVTSLTVGVFTLP